MRLTQKQDEAIKRIIAKTPLRQRDRAGESQVTHNGEDDGVIITNGFVLIHAPEPLGYPGPKQPDAVRYDRMNHYAHAAFDDDKSNFCMVEKPFRMEKVSSVLRKRLKENRWGVDKYGNEAIRVSATAPNGEEITSAFFCEYIVDAFEAVGKDAVAYIGMAKDMTPIPYMIVEPDGNVGNFSRGIHAVVMPTRL